VNNKLNLKIVKARDGKQYYAMPPTFFKYIEKRYLNIFKNI
jgi:hypothetical protein